MDLFNQPSLNAKHPSRKLSQAVNEPLASRMRPRTLEEFTGQSHILNEGALLRRIIESDRLSSLILYGPPGTGKTTLAGIIAERTQSVMENLNAVGANVADIRKVLDRSRESAKAFGRKTVLFIDEIHRFNKSQQDVLMPDVERGNPILIGATTHNPFFSIVSPLLSRSVVFELKSLTRGEIQSILERAIQDPERGLGKHRVEAVPEALKFLAEVCEGDARRALNALEVGVMTTPPRQGKIQFTLEVAQDSIQKKQVLYDKDEDGHYDTISAFIKSMRGSDPDAALYYLAKMLYAGEDPRFIARRMAILASEDVGNADPQAILVANAAFQICDQPRQRQGQAQAEGVPNVGKHLRHGSQPRTRRADFHERPKQYAVFKDLGMHWADVFPVVPNGGRPHRIDGDDRKRKHIPRVSQSRFQASPGSQQNSQPEKGGRPIQSCGQVQSACCRSFEIT